MVKQTGPTKVQLQKEERRYRAESLVRQVFESSPAYKQAVKETLKKLEVTEKQVGKTLKKPARG